jgi:hypothetical protein
VEALIRHFGSDNVILAISSDSDNPAMILMEKGKWNFWHTFQPSQAPIGLILTGNNINQESLIHDLIQCLPGYALGLGVLQQDPDHTAFREPRRFQNATVLDYIQTSRLTLAGSFSEYWRTRGKNLKKNMERQRRRIKENGDDFNIVEERDPRMVVSLLQEYEALEGAGWKGHMGTAVRSDNSQGRFYRDIFETAIRRDEGVIYRLLINGKTASCDLCLERNGMMVVLKTTYDETLPAISPNVLMWQEIVKSLYSRGKVKVIEFFGRAGDWDIISISTGIS